MYNELIKDISSEKKGKWETYLAKMSGKLDEYARMLKESSENFENNLNM